jgi:transcriptional regulator with XRE-family HTH domain
MKNEEYGSIHTLKSVRRKTGFNQSFFGMIIGMSKNAVSRIENGHRRETIMQIEFVSLVAFLFEKGLLEEYVQSRFRIPIKKQLK